MRKTNPLIIEKCMTLRGKGFTLGEITKIINLPKTTIYGYIYNIPLPNRVKERLIEESTERINDFNIKVRKGKCIPGRIVIRPKGWTKKLIFLAAHFLFDGEIQSHSCIYHNRNKTLINHVRQLMEKIFALKPKNWLNKETGVYRISYHHVELADYMQGKSQELKKYIQNASSAEKKIFLKAFFDDEGCASWRQKKREVRGYQQNSEILELIQKLLKDFDIGSKIDQKYQEITISRKSNLIKFRNKINFSKSVYINPKRKNSIWKKKLEKREILNRIITSYQK